MPFVVRERVGLNVLDAVSENLPVRGVELAVCKIAAQGLLDETQVVFAAQFAAPCCDDPTIRRNLPIAVAVIVGTDPLAIGTSGIIK